MAQDLIAQVKSARETNVTQKSHSSIYPAVDLSRQALSQAGQTVLVTGGGTTVGLSISRSFVLAGADTVIIIGRRAEVLSTAAAELEQLKKSKNKTTRIITRPCDVLNLAEVEALWAYLAEQKISVDVYVANAAKFTEPKPILELGADEVWSQVETNAKSPLYFVEKLHAQAGNKKKFVVNVSSQAAYMTAHPIVASRPAYTFSKLAGTHLFQLIAQGVSVEKMQIVSIHPGIIWTREWEKMGVTSDLLDDDELCGAFAVWAASEEAAFLHGRFVWASWDVEELQTGSIRERIEQDPYFLRVSIEGA